MFQTEWWVLQNKAFNSFWITKGKFFLCLIWYPPKGGCQNFDSATPKGVKKLTHRLNRQHNIWYAHPDLTTICGVEKANKINSLQAKTCTKSDFWPTHSEKNFPLKSMTYEADSEKTWCFPFSVLHLYYEKNNKYTRLGWNLFNTRSDSPTNDWIFNQRWGRFATIDNNCYANCRSIFFPN